MKLGYKKSELGFSALSYGVVICGFLSLVSTGEIGTMMILVFAASVLFAWWAERRGIQLSDRVGTAILVLSIPAFYLAWQYRLIGDSATESQIAGLLARLIVALSIIKLLQKKSYRDWLFLYLMSFFEVMLAAGMSVSPAYFLSLVLYLLVTICAIVAFEIDQTSRRISSLGNSLPDSIQAEKTHFRSLPLTAVGLLILIILIALPVFFALPRTGGAGFGVTGRSLSGFTGFSDSVELGSIGRLKKNSEVVMRVKLDDASIRTKQPVKWRGVSLDTFDGRKWTRSADSKEPFVKVAGDFMRFDRSAAAEEDIAIQTVYLEPINSDVAFGMSRAFAARQDRFPVLYKDSAGNLSFPRSDAERISYTLFSDRKTPKLEDLISDSGSDPNGTAVKYFQLPTVDKRISDLAAEVSSGEKSRYEKAKAIESYLQTQFGYTLEMKAGGNDPLADFLFNVREGHCEYFATAMTVMLRTQGIPARMVNGFQRGEFNELAGAYIIRQSDAHSWVEVYFPDSDSWVAFDPTPFAGQFNEPAAEGILGRINGYLEALETAWITYFVAFDDQGQRSLFRSVKEGVSEFQTESSSWIKSIEAELLNWWKEIRGDKGLRASAAAGLYGLAIVASIAAVAVLLAFTVRRIKTGNFLSRFRSIFGKKGNKREVEFYERLQKVLASKGIMRQPHQTPMEFAFAINMPEAVKITEKYNRVRFGEKNLSNIEAQQIENWLNKLEKSDNRK